jgi:hypothetical protein
MRSRVPGSDASLLFLSLLVTACATAPAATPRASGAAPGAAPTPAQQSAAPASATDTISAERDRLAREVRASIAGRENDPAEKVFKNIKSLTGVPAGRLLAIMNIGYGKSLGVGCAHCHVVGQWESESKPQKQIAREMAKMAATINGQLLAGIQNLKGPNAVVNCTTCHRGAVKPALNLP